MPRPSTNRNACMPPKWGSVEERNEEPVTFPAALMPRPMLLLPPSVPRSSMVAVGSHPASGSASRDAA